MRTKLDFIVPSVSAIHIRLLDVVDECVFTRNSSYCCSAS